MGSHRDDDHEMRKVFSDLLDTKSIDALMAERRSSLIKRAEEMTLRRENEITAGAIGEDVLYEGHHKGVFVRRLPDDPNGVVRISLGCAQEEGSAYLVVRGNPLGISRLLDKAVSAFRKAVSEGL